MRTNNIIDYELVRSSSYQRK